MSKHYNDDSIIKYASRIADIFEEALFPESTKQNSTKNNANISDSGGLMDILDQLDSNPTEPILTESLPNPSEDEIKQTINDIFYNEDAEVMEMPKVIFDKNATTLLWSDGVKVTVKAHGEPIDHEKGYAMAIAKYVFLDKEGHWYNAFHREIEKAEADEARRIASKAMKDLRQVYKKAYEKAMMKYTQERITEDGVIINGNGIQEDPKDILTDEAWHECFVKAHTKAKEATMRQYRNNKGENYTYNSGLEFYMIDDAIKTAINSYHEQMLRQH